MCFHMRSVIRSRYFPLLLLRNELFLSAETPRRTVSFGNSILFFHLFFLNLSLTSDNPTLSLLFILQEVNLVSVDLLNCSVQQQPLCPCLTGHWYTLLSALMPSIQITSSLPPVLRSFTDQLCLRCGLLLWWPGEPFPPESPPLQPLVCGWDWPAPTGSRLPGCLLARECRVLTSGPAEALWSYRSQWSRPGPCLCGRG